MKKTQEKGFTLIEMLIVVTVFIMISLIASQTIITTLISTKKADSITKVRQNLDFAMGEMERQLRSSQSITSTCPNSDTSQISFIDQNGNPVTFSCVGTGGSGQSYIASSSASLTSSDIAIKSCSFTCDPASGSNPSNPKKLLIY